MMIELKAVFVDCVIGRRGMINTAFSLWPCRIRHLKFYMAGIVFLLLAVLQATPVEGKETAAPAGPLSETESASPNAPAPMTDIHDIQPPVSVGIESPWLVPVLLALTAAAILALGWWLWKKRKKDRTVETIVPELPPEMTAMHALDQISDVRRLDGKTFYFRLSAILRQYVYGRYAVGAQEMTTEEFMPCIDRMNLDHQLARKLRALCRAMDPVKFGSETVVEKKMETDLFFAREFVRKTTQKFQMEKDNTNIEPSATITLENKNSNQQIPNFK